MAVELAKVALWLHTFTAGAPLSFLDHHLRCGDSLFGEWADTAIREVEQPAAGRGRRATPFAGAGLFLAAAVQRALSAEVVMARVEASPDAVLAEVEQSAADWEDAAERVRPLQAYLDFRQAVRWMALTPEDATAVSALLDGRFGDPLAILAGEAQPTAPAGAEPVAQGDLLAPREPEQLDLLPNAASVRDWRAAVRLVAEARQIAGRERFLHWQTAFPGVWRGWRDTRTGGFDAVIGNPPWDRNEDAGGGVVRRARSRHRPPGARGGPQGRHRRPCAAPPTRSSPTTTRPPRARRRACASRARAGRTR